MDERQTATFEAYTAVMRDMTVAQQKTNDKLESIAKTLCDIPDEMRRDFSAMESSIEHKIEEKIAQAHTIGKESRDNSLKLAAAMWAAYQLLKDSALIVVMLVIVDKIPGGEIIELIKWFLGGVGAYVTKHGIELATSKRNGKTNVQS